MTHEVLIKRTLYISKCPKCGDEKTLDSNAPKERLCVCGEWTPYEEVSAINPEYKHLPRPKP